MMQVKIYNCQFKDIDNIYVLSQALAHYFPKPDQFVTGIHELLLNAVEHGNLGIGFEAKAELLRQGKWQDEILKRLSMPEFAEKNVDINLTYDDQVCKLTIADQGKGFPWQKFIGQPMAGRQLNGRGLWIAFNSKFDRIMFNPTGNEVTCIAEKEHWPASKSFISMAKVS